MAIHLSSVELPNCIPVKAGTQGSRVQAILGSVPKKRNLAELDGEVLLE